MLKTAILAATTNLVYDQRVQRAGKALERSGWQVLLVGREFPGSPPLDNGSFNGYRIRTWFSRGKGMYLEFNIRLFLFLLGKKESVFVANDLDTLPGVWLAARVLSRKLVFDAHEYFSEVPEVINRPATRKIWQMLEGFLIPKADLAYTVSGSLAALFSKTYGRKFYVIRNLPEKSVPPVLPIKNKTIIYTGAVNAGRALEHLIQAIPLLPEDVNVRICGDGDILPALRALASDKGLGDRVAFTGYLNPAELRIEVASAWLGYCCAEPFGTSYLLSLSNKFFEYMQAGLPQLMPPFQEFVRINQEFQLGMEVEADSGKVAEAVNRLYADEPLYLKMRAGALRAGEVLTWESESKVLVRLFEGMIKG